MNWFKQWLRRFTGIESELASAQANYNLCHKTLGAYISDNGDLRKKLTSKLPPVSGCPDWTVEHAKQWRTFLLTPAGHDLLARARAREASLAITEASDLDAPRICRGMTFTLNWLESLANAELISASAAANAEQSEDDSEHVTTSNERSTEH